MKLNFKILSAVVMFALMVLSIGDGFAMNCPSNIMENHSGEEQRVFKEVTQERLRSVAHSMSVFGEIMERQQKSRDRSLDEIICDELYSRDYRGCRTLEDKQDVIMSLWPKINARNPAGHSALGDAIQSRNLKLTKYLVENGADTTNMDGSRRTAVMRAIQYHSPDIAMYLVERGHSHPWFKEKWSTDTELLLAVGEGYYDVVKCMVEHGASVDLSNKHGDTPLMRAVREGYLNIAKYLVKQGGADISAKNRKGETAQDFIEDGLRKVKFGMECLLKKD